MCVENDETFDVNACSQDLWWINKMQNLSSPGNICDGLPTTSKTTVLFQVFKFYMYYVKMFQVQVQVHLETAHLSC